MFGKPSLVIWQGWSAFLILALIASGGLAAPTDAHAAPPQPSSAPIQLRAGTFIPNLDLPPAMPADLTIETVPAERPGYYIVQFRGPVQESWKDLVLKLGGTLFDYIPDFAFIVRMDDAARGEVEKLPEVTWVGPFQPGYKLSPELKDAQGVRELVIQIFPQEQIEVIAQQFQALGMQVDAAAADAFGGMLRVRAEVGLLSVLANFPEVRWVEPFYERVLFNDVARSNAVMGAETVWTDLGLYGQGQVIAVSDTGLDTGDLDTLHQDFLGSPAGCTGTSRILATYTLGRSGDWSDSCYNGGNKGGHGTHVAGSVLGNGCRSGSSGVPDYAGSYAGLAPQASLVFQSVMDSSCALGGLPDDLNTLFLQARNAGARIHTNSWGAAVAGQYTTDARNSDLFTWNNKDQTILFSAGNEGIDSSPADGYIDLDSLGSPATAKNVITVGASESYRLSGGVTSSYGAYWPTDYPTEPIKSDRVSDNSAGMVAFSSRGPTNDGRIKPDVIAPGTNILSTKSQGTYVSSGWGAGPNEYYQYMGGTSMATPLTAGAVALIRQYYTDVKGITPSAALLKATLINSATDMYPGQYASPQEQNPRLPNTAQGWGRVNVANAVSGGRVFQDVSDANGLPTGGSQAANYVVCDASAFKATLVWTDYPGSTAVTKQLVNDLDLLVTAPDGTIYRGNNFSEGWSVAGGSEDRTNNVESVYVSSPSAGSWTVTINGYNVPNGASSKQGYALVVDRPGNTAESCFAMQTTPAAVNLCAPELADYSVALNAIGGFDGPVTLAAAGAPAGAILAFGSSSMTPPGSTVLTLSDTAAAADGTYVITVSGASGTLTQQNTVTVGISHAAPAAPVLTGPADGSTDANITPTLTWDAVATATSYDIQVATDPGLASVVAAGTGLTSASFTPAAPLSNDTVYYWRVRAVNTCGSKLSAVRAFRTTAPPPCSNILADGSFEQGPPPASAWSEYSSWGYEAIRTTNVHAGAYAAWLGGLIYEDTQVWQTVSIPGDATSVTLSYWYCIDSTDSCGRDYGYVRVNGTAVTGYDLCTATDTGVYVRATKDLTGYAGATELRFRATNNQVKASSFYVDDVSLTVCAVADPTTADYSDLPASYGIAWHTGDGSLRLGAAWDADSGFSADADNTRSDDGVSFVGSLVASTGGIIRLNVQGTPSSGRWARAWFDWNGDGMFGTGELALDGAVSDWNNDLNLTIPAAVRDAVNYRVRLDDSGTAPAAGAWGGTAGGEVEDGRSPCVAAAAISEITISDLGNDQLQLSWTVPAGATKYQVWRALNEPYFSPGADCSAPGAYACFETTATSLPDDAAGDNPTYVVRAVSTCGGHSEAAYRRLGRFRFSLTPGE